MKDLPRQIIKKSPNWYYDTTAGKYIHVKNLQTYVDGLRQLKLKV